MKNGEDFRREFPQAEEDFRDAEYQALMQLHEKKRRTHMKFKPVIAFVLLLALLMSVGVAATVEKWSLFDSVPESWRTATDAEKAQMKSSFEPVFIDGSRVDATIREAIYDGFGVYLVVDMKPVSSKVFLLPSDNADLDAPAQDAVRSFPADVTLEEHIKTLGYTQIYRVYFSIGLLGTLFPATMEVNEDGSFAFFYRQRLNQAEDLQQSSIDFGFMTFLQSGTKFLEDLNADVTLDAQPLLEVRNSMAGESHDFVNSGARMSNVQVYRTILTTYVIADVEVIDQEQYDSRSMQYFLRVRDSEGGDIPPGYFNLIAITTNTDDGTLKYTSTLSMHAIPDELSFVEYQYDRDAGNQPVDSWIFQLEDVE